MIVAHVMGVPIEESLLQLMPAAAVLAAATGVALRSSFERARRLRRNGAGKHVERGRW
jgi:hypothetical protein